MGFLELKQKKKDVKEEIKDTPKIKLFDFINAIHHTKVDLMKDNEDVEQQYSSYMVNKALSFGADTIFFANAMNALPHLDKKLNFNFFLNSIRPMKRYNTWAKGEKDEDLTLIQRYYGYNVVKARIALRILTSQQLNTIRKRMDIGGAHDT